MKLRASFSLTLSLLALGWTAPTAQAAPQPATRVEIDRTEFPHAKCNDDTQATYYLRGAGPNGAVSGRKWLIFLHGGGHCSSDAECAERWYDPDGGPDGIIGFHGNMTASTEPSKNFDGEGHLDADGVDGVPVATQGSNPFAEFNRIMVPYCSSDTYSGKNTSARAVNYAAYVGTTVTIDGKSVTINNPGNAIPPLTSIRFAGRHIVEAVAQLLMNGGIKSGRKLNKDSESYVAPPSAASDEVVLSGSSAGGGGVIRNLDNVAKIVQGAAASVKVFGIVDASDAVGAVPDSSVTGDTEYANASFYLATSSDEVDKSCQAVYPISTSKKCFSNLVVLKSFIETPHFVVQQAYDGVIHGGLMQSIALQLAQMLPAAQAESLATQYIRNRISLGALELGGGVANPQQVGYFIPNYMTAKHQLIVEDLWFFNNPLAYTNHGGNDPRLGTDTQSTLGLPRSLACFRFKVSGQGSGCVNGNDAKVINSTYPTNPFLATYDATTSTLTLPYVRLSNNTYFKNVTVTLNPLGAVVVNDPGVAGLGGLNEYDPATNVLKLPFVSSGGTTYERVKVTGPGLRVLGYEVLSF